MKPDKTPSNAAEDSAAAPEQALTDEELNAVVGGVGELVHESTHASTSTSAGGRTYTGGRFSLDIGKFNAGYTK